MRWIKAHKLITFLIVIILASLLVTGISATTGSGESASGFLKSAISIVEKPFVKISGKISGEFSGMLSYKKLAEENEKLREENVALKKELSDVALSSKELSDLRDLADALNYKLEDDQNKIVTADIVFSNIGSASWMSNFTIDKGTEMGIEPGNTVIYGRNLVGKVVDAGRGYANISSIVDHSNKVSFNISGNLDLVGIIDSAKDGSLEGFMLENDAKVNEGDLLVTSGLGIYPSGLEIGRVNKIKYDSNSQLLRVRIKPAVNFKSLQKVTVII